MRLYQNPEAIKTTEEPKANKIKNGDGSMYHATTAATADNPPHR